MVLVDNQRISIVLESLAFFFETEENAGTAIFAFDFCEYLL